MFERLKQHLPTKEELIHHPAVNFWGDLIHRPELWQFSRKTVPGGIACGLFFAWLPVPFQFVYASVAAMFLRVNLPLSFGLVFVTNPITIAPLYYLSFRLGNWLMGSSLTIMPFNLRTLMANFFAAYRQIALGGVILGALSALVSYYVSKWLMARRIWRRWRLRRRRK